MSTTPSELFIPIRKFVLSSFISSLSSWLIPLIDKTSNSLFFVASSIPSSNITLASEPKVTVPLSYVMLWGIGYISYSSPFFSLLSVANTFCTGKLDNKVTAITKAMILLTNSISLLPFFRIVFPPYFPFYIWYNLFPQHITIFMILCQYITNNLTY